MMWGRLACVCRWLKRRRRCGLSWLVPEYPWLVVRLRTCKGCVIHVTCHVFL
ncbi:hypothetical protein BX661DRAFT_187705 [Kickxella alabastrina]|uniref:uncharacterized protein n=1 Tax=Kickxella alabastrina TaxID=61397 RepID=UPI00221EBAAB|nr:uncharacterized protein BX661DRAFT_187705 [Kickxella alabastrina]KAI7822080.1 hypothetical protein BX661DRAFT_187705 [Kickxella alabastrina]